MAAMSFLHRAVARRAGAALALAWGLAACGSAQPSAAPKAPLQKVTVNVSSFSYQHLKAVLAKEAGLFAKNGLDVDVVTGNSGIPAAIAGEVQIVTTSGEAAILSNVGGSDLELVANGAPYLLQDFLVRPEIGSMADLRGKPVGVSERGTVTETVARMAAQRGGLDPDRDMQLVAVGGPDKAVVALSAGAIFGAGLTSPNTEAAISQGQHILYNFSAEKFPYPSANTIVRRDWAQKNEATLVAYLRSLAEAVQLYRTRTDYVTDVYARWAKIDQAAARAAIELGIKTMPIDKMVPTAEGIKVLQQIVSQQNPAAANADISRFYDDRYMKKLQSEGVLDQLMK
jgi:NitT/TauT family transport system substrate-binding protein